MNERSELRAMIDHASKWAEKQLRKHGGVPPMWHAVTAKGEDLLIPRPSPDKDVSAALVRTLFEIKQVVRYVFVDEAWMVAERKPGLTDKELDHYLEQMRRHGISDHRDRQEVVMFSAEDENGFMFATRHLIRDGNKVTLSPLIFPTERGKDEGGYWEGRIVGMLPRRAGTRVQ